jgi:hypothetical protein
VDYILFGAGTGASLAVIGWILREWGPRLRDGRTNDDVIYSASELIDRMSWARFCASCGMAMVAAGTLILLATAVVAAWNPGDQLASRILVGMYVFVSLLMLLWAFLYTRQFGTSGIYRPVVVDPASDTREAVPVVERETADRADAVPLVDDPGVVPGDEPSAAPEPDFAEVAARRGGLSRFASFFNRQRPADAMDHDGGDVSEGADGDTDTDPGEEVRPVGTDIPDAAAGGEAPGEPGSVIETAAIDVAASTAEVEPDIGQVAPDAATTGDDAGANGQPTDLEVDTLSIVEVADEPAPASGPVTPAPQPTPEEEALAELRRRRLARLSGQDH